MSYQRPHDPYMHSNASQYDNQYAGQSQGGYNDYPQQGGAGYHYGSQTPQSDHYYKDGSYGGAAPGSGHNPANANAAKYSYAPAKKGKSKWVKFGIPAIIILLLIIAGGVLGGIFGSRAAKKNKDGSGSSSTGGSSFSGASDTNVKSSFSSSLAAQASAAASAGGSDQLFYSGTDLYGNPQFLSSANTASVSGNGNEVATCTDSNPPSGSLAANALRAHPRIMAAQYEWDCLPNKIAKDAYLTVWNATIFQNATKWAAMDPVNYTVDGTFSGSGILDPAREVQQRIKAWGYAYRMSKDTKWADRAWTELQAAAGNSTSDPWNPTAVDASQGKNATWNPSHFLDTAELTAAFAIGYDWLYDVWTPQQRTAIMWSIITLGLDQGMQQYNTDAGWWKNTNGNWNCVCNSGLLLGALAIWTEDPSGTAASVVAQAVPNMKSNCMKGAYEDGTWSETANYWYFGTAAQARALSALLTSTGSDQGLSAANANWAKTGDFHMYVSGNAGLFAYGDHGPNKYSATANGMFLWAKQYKNPVYGLFQRDRADAVNDPLSMFWYDTSSKGAFWNGLALDKFFNNPLGSWGSMRSSWTDFTGTYIGIKSSNATGHQTHGDLDAGDFVLDAMGTRWAGEYGSGNYLSKEYFKSEEQGALRWQYYRKGTQGQNTLVINNRDQSASCDPQNRMLSSNTTQSADRDFVPETSSTALFITDMSSCYNQSTNGVQRGIRFLNGRRQVLVQDEIASSSSITSVEWRMQTNATITLSSDKKTATLKINSVTDPNAWGGVDNGPNPYKANLDKTRTMIVTLQNPSNAEFNVQGPPAKRIYGTDPNTQPNEYGPDEDGDQVNVGVSVLSIKLPSPSGTVQVWFQPQWDNSKSGDSTAPANVALAQWSLTSHN
ncbi:unnamed protein product [Parajaminaea phylloscopi]